MIIAFLVLALAVNYYFSRGITADETSYRFQADVIASGALKAEPPPGNEAGLVPPPLPLAHRHVIIGPHGWYSKYPLLWPLVLAIPERLRLAWLVTPILGVALITMTGRMARQMFDRGVAGTAIAFAVLSPYVLSQSTGLMSHALCAIMIIGATWLCWVGVERHQLAPLVWMLILLALSLHARIFTGFLFAVLLDLFALWHCRRDPRLTWRFVAASCVVGLACIVSMLAYNRYFTGVATLSPYAVYLGQASPQEIAISPKSILHTLISVRSISIEGTVLYAFPFLFPMALYGFWAKRAVRAAQLLAWCFPVIFVGYLLQPDASSSLVGERYFYEAYFSLLILAATGVSTAVARWRLPKPISRVLVTSLLAVQVSFTGIAIFRLAVVISPYIAVAQAASRYEHCECAVFMAAMPNVFDPQNLNLNTPQWKEREVYYFNDPGVNERAEWATKFGWHKWVVMHWDGDARAVIETTGTDGT